MDALYGCDIHDIGNDDDGDETDKFKIPMVIIIIIFFVSHQFRYCTMIFIFISKHLPFIGDCC